MAVATIAAPSVERQQTRTIALGTFQAMLLPLAFILALAALGVVPSVRQQPNLLGSILGTAVILSIGVALLWARAGHRTFAIDIQLRPQHYLQACAQLSVLLYWGWYWRPVYEAAYLIVAQLLFAYAFDILLAWSRRDRYTLGFAPFPVIFSINLFLWFKPDWFYLQFLMIAVGFAAKELIRWNKDGRRTHIFNPSSFPLAVFSIALLLTGTTSMTFGREIASTQFNPPNIYLMLFLIGLPGQFLFGVTTMTMSAVLTTYLFGAAYFAITGSYFFIDSYIPIAVFLGMHLLFTDPSTSPRTELGRILFGVMYGLGNIVLYELLGRAGLPSFYDKLLPVPLMNLSIKLIDRVARSPWLKIFDPARLAPSLTGRRRNLAYITVWAAVFAAMSSVDAVGDNHPGHRVPFWQNACIQNSRNACTNLSLILATYCTDGSGWACNELGSLRFHREPGIRPNQIVEFGAACANGFQPGCQNALAMTKGSSEPPRQAAPLLRDYPVILRTGKGALPDTTPVQLLTRACDQGWSKGCEDLGNAYLKGAATPRDPVRAAAAYEKACASGLAMSCSNIGLIYFQADGVPQDRGRGLEYLKRACDLGMANACRWHSENR